MRKYGSALMILVLLVFAGCWPLSISPLYTQEDLVFDNNLVGIWSDDDNSNGEIWTFHQKDDLTYRLVIQEKEDLDNPGSFEAHLLELDGKRYLDLYPEEMDCGNEFFRAHVIPAHTFFRISVQGHVLVLDFLSTEKLGEILEKDSTALRHETRDDFVAITASTKELQQFIIEHSEELFDDYGVAKRL